MKSSKYLMDHILYQIFKITYSRLLMYQIIQAYILKKNGEKTINHSTRIYVNKIENRITFKIKTGYYLELLTPQTMKLLVPKDRNGENVPLLEVTDVLLVHCNIVQEPCIHLFLINYLVNY